MRLSILDQSPIASGSTALQALQGSVKLAQLGEKLGYTRYWITEHHDLAGLASSAPEVMLSYIGSRTESIRIGSGAVLLPHYKPFKVAETFNMLATLFPHRIDLGIGRAPGGSAEATMALSDNYLEQVRNMPEKIKELLYFIHNDYPMDHMFSKIAASPLPPTPPEPWILGTSEKSAVWAAENGIAYAFGHFMSDQDGSQIINTYLRNFKATDKLRKPSVLAAVSVICAETSEKAEELALSERMWKLQLASGEGRKGIPSVEEAKLFFQQGDNVDKMKDIQSKIVIGNPREVKQQLSELQEAYQADEMMLITITHRLEDRLRSYELLAQEMWGHS